VVIRHAPYIYRDRLQFLSGELWLLVREDFLEEIVLKKIVNFSNINRT
jgi:hypothetical protein